MKAPAGCDILMSALVINAADDNGGIMLSKILASFSTPEKDTDNDAWWLPLDPETPLDTSVLGDKGAGLVRLMQAGFNVPAGVIMTTRFLHDFFFLEEPEVRRMFDDTITTPARSDVLWAVRCSVADGEKTRASLVDRLGTVLNVPSAELFDCVKHCWASVYAQPGRIYQTVPENGSRPFLAIILQQMIAMQSAGVLCMGDPSNSDGDSILIKGVAGLNKDLRGGLCKPDCLRLSREGDRLSTETVDTVNCLDRIGDAVFVQLARDLTQTFGAPQDVDWVYDGRTLWVLESRPSTAWPAPTP